MPTPTLTTRLADRIAVTASSTQFASHVNVVEGTIPLVQSTVMRRLVTDVFVFEMVFDVGCAPVGVAVEVCVAAGRRGRGIGRWP